MRAIYQTLCAIGILLSLWNTGYAQTNCREGPLDVLFIAESSIETGKRGFGILVNFIKNVADTIGISKDWNRISLTLFNKEVKDVLELKNSKGMKELTEFIDETEFWSGGNRVTNAGKVMEYVADNKFDPKRGRRPDRPAVCVIIIEGVASDMTEAAANKLKEKCRVIILGIDRPNYFELSRIASAPTLGHIKTLQTYIDLVRYVKWVSSTICNPPIAAMQLERGRVTHNSIQITWDVQPYASKYVVHLRLSGKKKPLKIRNILGSLNNITFTGLTEGTSYSFDGWPYNLDGGKGPRAAIFISSGIKVPTMSIDPLATKKTSTTVTWPAAKLRGVTYYMTVREADTGQFVYGTGVSGTGFEITNLRPGTGYSVELIAVYKGARSESDDRLIFYTVPDPPKPTTAYVTDRAVRLEWNEIRGATTYGIRTYDTETGGIELLVRVDETANKTFEIEPLLSGKKYKFTVTSKTSTGQESEESIPIFERIAPSNPRKIYLESRTTKAINISWDQQEGVKQYMVQFKITLSPDLLTRIVNATWFHAEGLATGAMYIFKVFSVGKDSKSDTENPATEKFQTVPGKVDALLVQKITQNSVTLQWSKTRGAEQYLLRFKDAISKRVLKSVRIKGDTAQVGGLQTGITYLITVSAVGQGDIVGQESDPQMVITLPDVPGLPQLTGKKNSTLTFKWDSVAGAIQYVLEIKEDGNTGPSQFRTRKTSYTFDSLKPGTWYEFSLRSVGSGGRINMQASESARAQTIPRIPAKPRITDLTATTVTVTWEKSKGATGYILNIRLVGKRKLLETRNTTENVYRVVNLEGGESYLAGVIAYDRDGRMTEESAKTLMKTMPEAPGKPRVLSVSSSTATLEWDEVKDKRKLTEVQTDQTTFKIEDLKPSTHYSFGLYSVAIEGTRNKKESERVEAITAPSPPSEVRVKKAGTNYVELAWNAVRGAVSYTVRYRSIRVDEGLESGEVEASNPSFQTISKLTAGVIYEFSVIAIGQDGSESDPGILIDGTLPVTPDEPLVLLIGSTNATLSWNPAKGALSYIVKASAKGFDEEFTTDTTRVDVIGLESGTKYEFTVMSVGINNRVNFVESEKKREQTLTSAPFNFKFNDVTTTTIGLSWDKMKGAVHYSVSVELADGTPVRKYMALETTYVLRRLQPGTEYSISVASVGTNLIESDFSEPLLVSTVPGAPQAPQVVEVTSTTVELTWKPVKGARLYTLGVREDGKVKVERFSVTESKIQVVELEPGTWYEFFIYSVGSGKLKKSEQSGEIRVQTVPAIPTNFNFVNATTNSITVTWDKMKGAKDYGITVMQEEEVVANLTTGQNVVTAWDLLPGTMYTLAVSSYGEEGRKTVDSKPVTESTLTDAPMQPVVIDISSTTATLDWDGVPGAISYVVFYTNRDESKKREENVKESKIILSNLSPGTWYKFSVISIGESKKPSKESPVLDEQTVPLPPQNVQVRNVGMDFIAIVWDKSQGSSSYRAAYTWRDADNKIQRKITKTESTSIRFSDLIAGTEYEITVQAVGKTLRVSPGSDSIEENTIPNTPGDPMVMSVGEDMFKIQWKGVKGAASYVVEITPEVGRKLYRETEQTEWIEGRRRPGKWFKINVQSKDRKNRGNGIASQMLEVQTICLRPSALKMTEIGTKSVKFDWDFMEGADFYLVTVLWSMKNDIINTFGGQEIQDDETILWGGKSGKKKDALKSTNLESYKIVPEEVVVKDHRASFRIQTRTNHIEIGGLDSATRYNFEFESVNKQGRVSTQKAYLNETTLPSKVEVVSLLEIAESSAVLAWDAVNGVQEYVVNVTRQLNREVTTHTTIDPTITLKELTPGSWYSAKIFTDGSSGNMNYDGSDELSFQTIPSRPENVVITNVTTSTMELAWEGDEAVAYYKIIVRLTRPSNVLFRVEETRTNHHLVENLDPGTKFLFTVVSVATGGRESRPSKLIVETTIPAKPTNLRLMDMSSTTASLQWDNVPGAFRFIINIRGDDRTNKEVRTRGTVITIEDLIPGVWYDFWIRSAAENGRINHEESDIVRQQTVPRSPGKLKVEEVTTTTISLSWRKIHGIKQYQIFVEDTSGSQQVHNVTRSFYTLSQLTSGERYTINVVAVGTSGQNSQKSETVVIATVPTSADGPRVVGVSTTHVELQWTPVTGAAEYTILMRNPENGRVVRSIDTRQFSHIVTPLQPGSTYIFSVVVKGQNKKQSGESPQIQVQTTPLSPTGVKVGLVTTSTIALRWKPVPGVKLYKVVIREQDSPDDIWRIDEVQKTEHTVSSLRSGSTYLLGVITVGTRGRESDSSEIVTETTYPETPTGLEITRISTTSIVMTWNQVIGARHYVVQVQGDDKTKKELTVYETEATIPALSPGTWYRVQVVAVGKKTRQSQPSEKLRDQTAPLPPTKLLVTKIGTTFISFKWQPVFGVKFYDVAIHSLTQDGKNSSQTFVSDTTEYTINELVPGTPHTITIVGVGTSGRKSGPSESLHKTTVPAVLDEVIIRDATTTSITLDWNEVTGASSYTIVIRSANDRTGAIIRSIDTTLTTFTVPALVPGESYFFSIRSKGFGGKLSKESPRVKAQTVPLPPSRFQATDVRTSTVSLSWKAANGADFYRVSVRDDDGVLLKTDEVKSTEHTVDGLNPGTEYAFTISAIGTSGRQSEESSPVSQVTKPSGPTGVTITAVQTMTMSVTWNQVKGARSYRVIVENIDIKEEEIYDAFNNRYTITGLSPGSQYAVSVTSIGADGQESVPSERVLEQTIPSSPTNVVMIDVKETSMTLKWDRVFGVVGYVVVMRDPESGSETRTETEENRITVSDLAPGTQYEFSVLSIGRKERINAKPSKPVVEQTVSSQVQGLRVATVTPTSVSLRWSRSPGVARYIIKVRDYATGATIATFNVIALELLVEDLLPGKNYTFTVTSVARNGKQSEESDELVVSTDVPSLSKPTVERITNSSVVLEWEEVEGARGYIVSVTNVDEDATIKLTVEEEFVFVSDLLPGYSYTFTLTAVGESGRLSSESESVTVDTIPATTQIVDVGKVTTSSITFTWNKVKGALRYTALARWQRPGERRKRVVNTTTTKTTLEMQLPFPGMSYQISVRAEGESGASRQSKIVEENTLPEAPPRPSASEVLSTSITLIWEPVPGAESYEVVVTDESTRRANTLIVHRPAAQLTKLKPGAWYKVQLFSRDVKQRKNKVGSDSVRIQTVPTSPPNARITSVTASSITIAWGNVEGASMYEIEVKAQEGDTSIISENWKNVNIDGKEVSFQITTTERSTTVDGLEAGSTFRFEVRSIGAQQRKSEPVRLEDTTLPGTVEEMTVREVSTSSVTIEWPDVKGAAFYRVQSRGENDRRPSFSVVQQPSITFDSLSSGTLYNVTIVTYDVQNRTSGTRSPGLGFQTVPRQIDQVETSHVTTNSMVIRWRTVKGAETYDVKLFWIAEDVSLGHLKGDVPADKDGLTYRSFQTPLTEVNASQLDPGTMYSYEVTVLSRDGRRSEPSRRRNETTLPAAISEITIISATETTLSLSWDEIKGAQNYLVKITAVRESLPPMTRETEKPEIFIKGLESGVLYEVVVQPVGEKERRDRIESASVKVKTIPKSPEDVKVEKVTEKNITVSWKPSRGTFQYRVFVEFRDPFRRVQTLEFETKDIEYEITDLQPGDSYTIYIVAYGNRFEASASKRSEVLVQRTMLSPPTNLLLGGFGDDYILLSWEASAGATSYVINVREIETDVVTQINVDNDMLSYDVTNLEPGALYAFTIQARNVKDKMSSSNSQEIQQRTRPAPPQSLRVVDVGATKMEITWNPVLGASTYTIYLTEKGFTEQTIPDHPTNSLILDKLSPGTEYRIQVTAVTVEGIEGRRSDRITQVTAPNAPGKPEIKFFTTDSVEMEWTRMKGVTTYVITVTDEETGKAAEIDAGSTLTFKVEDLKPGTVYSFTVRGENLESKLRSAESESVTQGTYPLAPTVEVVSFSPERISIAWEPVKGAVKYTVFFKRSENIRRPKEIENMKETSYTLEELESGTEYEIQVIAITEEGLKSDRSLRIIQSTAPNTPSGLETYNVTQTSMSVSWFPASGATMYTLVMTNMETSGRTRVNLAGDLRHTFMRLKPGTLFQIYAYAITLPDNTRSERSEIVETRTLPAVPRRLLAFDVKETSVSLEWKRVKGGDTYTVYVNKVNDSLTLERQVKNLKKTEVSIDRLSPGSLYQFEVAAVTENGLPGKRSDPLEQQTVPAPPQDIAMDQITSTSFRTTWTKSEGASSYALRLTNEDTNEVRQKAVGNTNFTRFMRLIPGTVYRLTIIAQRKEADVASRNSRRVQQRTLPDPPANLRVVDVTINSVALEWPSAKGALSYNILIYEVNSSGFVVGDGLFIDQIQDTYVEIIELEPGTEYQFEVFAVTTEGLASEVGTTVRRNTRYLPPKFPVSSDPLVRLSNVTSSSMLAKWDKITNVATYTLVIRSNSEEDKLISDINETEMEISDLSANTEYFVTLIAVGRSGDETDESSPRAVATTLPLPPPAPTGLQQAEVTDNSVLLTWNPSARAISYEVEIEDSRTKKVTVVRGIVEPQYDIKDLQPGRRYVIRVIAVGMYERSRAGDEIQAGARHPIPVMEFTGETPIELTEVEWNSFIVTFPRLQGAVSYTLIVRKGGKRFRRIADLTRNRRKVGNLTEVTSYQVTYLAIGAGGDVSEESDPPLIVTTAPHTPDIPVGVKVSDITADSAMVEWEPSDRAISYDIIATEQTSRIPQFLEDATSPHMLTGLVFNTRYSLTVVAIGPHDRSAPSKAIRFKTKIPKPGDIRLIFTQFVSESEIWLLWSPATYAVSYTITVRENGKRVQQMREILGNSIRIENLKPDTEYEVGVKPVGLEKDEGNELTQFVTTLFGSVGQEQKDEEEESNVFGIGERIIDEEDEFGEDETENLPEAETLEEALSSLVSNMVDIPDDEIREDANGKQIIKDSSTFRTSLWKSIQTVRKFAMTDSAQDLAERKSDSASVQLQEVEDASEAMEKLILLSQTLKDDPQSLGRSGPKKVAFEIAGLLADIFIQTSDSQDDTETTEPEGIQERMAPILEELLTGIILGDFEVVVAQVGPRAITLNWTGVLPANTVDFMIREAGINEFLNRTTVDKETTEIRFVKLEPNTEYEIIVRRTGDERRTLYSESVKTKTVFTTRPPVPKGLRVAISARTYVSVRWQHVRRGDANIVYIVRLFKPKAKNPIERFDLQKGTTKQITKLKRKTSYEVTVSSYDVDARKQSRQSPRLRIRTK